MILDMFSELQKPDGMAESQLYQEAIEQAKLADEMGFGFLSYTQVEPQRFVAGEEIPAELAGRSVVGGGN